MITRTTVNKIFCIGWNKTGTTSLHQAFVILGLKSVHYACLKGKINVLIEKNLRNDRPLLAGIEKFDAFSDWNTRGTWRLYKSLDEQYPNSKFIFNTRDLESWLLSRERHVRSEPNLEQLQEKYPNHPWYHVNKDVWKKDFLELQEDVTSYFKDRPGDLLVIDIPAGEGWEKLCPFLDLPTPNVPFPHGNKTVRSASRLRGLMAKAMERFRLTAGLLSRSR